MLTAERVRATFNYDPKTGALTWAIKGAPCMTAGARAGWLEANGYMRVSIDNKQYRVHRIIWLLAYGEAPGQFIDHINGDRADNRLCNLRLATVQENARNQKARGDRPTAFKGVSFRPERAKPYCARIVLSSGSRFLGSFDTAEAAHHAYAAAAQKHFGEFARLE